MGNTDCLFWEVAQTVKNSIKICFCKFCDFLKNFFIRFTFVCLGLPGYVLSNTFDIIYLFPGYLISNPLWSIPYLYIHRLITWLTPPINKVKFLTKAIFIYVNNLILEPFLKSFLSAFLQIIMKLGRWSETSTKIFPLLTLMSSLRLLSS